MFDITKEDLKDLLRDVDDGKIQLPEFQRSYVWNDADVRSLLASVLKSFPVGALLTLETGGEIRFKPRMIEGAPAKERKPEELLLDGQQRITSLYQAAFSKQPVRTKNAKNAEVERFYYLDIKKTASSGENIEEAIVGATAERTVRFETGRSLDLSKPELEFAENMFPLNRIFDASSWLYDWQDYWRSRDQDVADLRRQFDQGLIDRFQRYKMPIIRLDRKNSREAICLVFEKVNVGGKKLDAFELLTAIYASDEFDLRADWEGHDPKAPGRRIKMIGSPNRRDVLTQLASTDFLQACTLLHTRAARLKKLDEGATGKDIPPVSCKRETLLSLPLDSYKNFADDVQAGFIMASEFLNELKIIWHRDVPYPPQLVALASVSAILQDSAETAAAKDKLARWLWSVTFGELYGSSTETRLGNDVPELVDWLTGSAGPPRSIEEALFQKDRLRSLRSRLSAAYKGLHALMMRKGCRDFISEKPVDIMTFFKNDIDIHHIFPQHWCKQNGIEPGVFNSIVNKTPLSKKTNILIGGDAPSLYLRRIEEKHGIKSAHLDDILRQSLIEPRFLRANDFDGFFADRLERLADIVGEAMGKPVIASALAAEATRHVIEPEEIEENEALEGLAA